jgi:hypothetical protein
MQSTLNDTMNVARNAIDGARHGTERAVVSTRESLMDAFHVVTGLVGMLRRLDGDDALGWIGLARRRSSLPSLLAFGAGVVVGAGVGVMLAPIPGAELRQQVVRRLTGQKEEANSSVEKVASAHGNGSGSPTTRPHV